jgi:hypothetical protein
MRYSDKVGRTVIKIEPSADDELRRLIYSESLELEIIICPPLKDLDVVVWIYTAFRRGSRPQRPDLTFKTKI